MFSYYFIHTYIYKRTHTPMSPNIHTDTLTTTCTHTNTHTHTHIYIYIYIRVTTKVLSFTRKIELIAEHFSCGNTLPLLIKLKKKKKKNQILISVFVEIHNPGHVFPAAQSSDTFVVLTFSAS